MNLKYKAGITYLTFSNFEKIDFIRHAFSTRIGGISKNEFGSMNLGLGRGDESDNVYKNFELICSAIGISSENIVLSAQTHNTNIIDITAADKGKGLFSQKDWDDADGMATCETGIFLAEFFADCVPIFFADPKRKIVAIAHAGWRGTVTDMPGKTIKHLVTRYGCDPVDILVGIGPSIGLCCFNVGDDVAAKFRVMPDTITKGSIMERADKSISEPNNVYIDLANINRNLLIAAGIPPQNIENAGICTSCNSEWLFSHRASKGKRGSLCAIIGLV